MVLVMGRRQLRVVVRQKIRYGPGSSCAVLSEVQRADFAAFVKILMTAQREVSREEVSQQPTKNSKNIIDRKQKGSPNRGSFVFIAFKIWQMLLMLRNRLYQQVAMLEYILYEQNLLELNLDSFPM